MQNRKETMALSIDDKGITPDDLLALVDKATQAIEHLQQENARLLRQANEYRLASEAAAFTLAEKQKRIEALEQAEAATQKDARWYRWFRAKYADSTFFAYIEREFLLSMHASNEKETPVGPVILGTVSGTAQGVGS
ncbi:MAG TPA: hypothetical protein VJ698_19235 [Noviherbaspirillum sp.]|uniref:hypothetical protein n=1 Tax=Noviherbaspirillum sp. TaxID=1926288 RepID=UPI002B492B13|nr:hypothetical protein [Noviherbaspirillum sp.]HJV87611.1 hypothetical protein [Noviherbaspirillum sp.]